MSAVNIDHAEHRAGSLCNSCYKAAAYDFCFECDVANASCDLCDRQFSQFVAYKDHLTEHRDNRQTEVRTCTIRLRNKKRPVNVYICSFCDEMFLDVRNLSIHSARIHHTDDSAFTCKHCGRKYRSRLSLQNHLREMHRAEKLSFQCDLCGYRFRSFANLKRHIYAHMNCKNYRCSLCDKTFNDEFVLSRHVKQHIQEKRYRCDKCEASFVFHFALKRHKLTHERNRKRFGCDHCGKWYSWKYDLQEHINGHMMIKAYKCSVCDKSFARNSHLVQHRVKHSDAKTFMCYCGKTFKFRTGLVRHKASHTK